MAVTAEIDNGVFITKVNEKLESLPYYDEISKKIKYHPAFFYITTGEKKWHKNGELHSFDDEPAMIMGHGAKVWYRNNEIHREGDLPAFIDGDGLSMHYYKNGKLHRDNDLPAVIRADGRECYYKNGVKYIPKSEQKEDDYFATLHKKIVDDKLLSVEQKQNAVIALSFLGMIINKK